MSTSVGTKKIVINTCYGVFELPLFAFNEYVGTKYPKNPPEIHMFMVKRDDPVLINVVEKYGNKLDTTVTRLAIVEIPADVDWEIVEFKGYEYVAEKHRKWGAWGSMTKDEEEEEEDDDWGIEDSSTEEESDEE